MVSFIIRLLERLRILEVEVDENSSLSERIQQDFMIQKLERSSISVEEMSKEHLLYQVVNLLQVLLVNIL
nr:MAG TPA: hypothetical protein [Caudoviricetes sp.]